MRTRSVNPSPDMSARNIDSLLSEKTSFGPFSSSSDWGTRCAVAKPSTDNEGCQVNAASSLIRRSAKPSPVKSMNLMFGLLQSSTGSEPKDLKRSQSAVSVRSKYPGVGPSKATTSRLPSPERSINCTRLVFNEAGDGWSASRCVGPKRGNVTSVPVLDCWLDGLRFDL